MKNDNEHKIIFGTDRAVRVNNVKSARRLIGRLIVNYQRGKISSEYSKTLCYILSTYVTTFIEDKKNG